MSRPSSHNHQAIPLSDPEAAASRDTGRNGDDEDEDLAAHNSATLEQNRSATNKNNRRHDKR